MKVRAIYDYIDSLAPFILAEPWDNPGLLTGSMEEEVTGILLSLDVTLESIRRAQEQGANLIVSHHPIIFSPIKRLMAGEIIYEATRRGISVISAHTNYDKAAGGVNDILAAALELRELDVLERASGFGRYGRLTAELSPGEFAKKIEQVTELAPRYNPNGKAIRTVGVCGGSGGDMLVPAIQAGIPLDALVTADVKHHEFLIADTMGLTIYDAGHYATEALAMPPLAEQLSARFPQLPIAIAGGYMGQIIS